MGGFIKSIFRGRDSAAPLHTAYLMVRLRHVGATMIFREVAILSENMPEQRGLEVVWCELHRERGASFAEASDAVRRWAAQRFPGLVLR